MIVSPALFLLPLLIAFRGEPAVRARGSALGAALAAAAALCLLVLWPYLRDREDVAAYASAAFAAHKPWGQAYLADLAISPPEYGQLGWPLEPWASWDGAYPGAAFVLLLASVASLLSPGPRRLRAGWLRRHPKGVPHSRFEARARRHAARAGAARWW